MTSADTLRNNIINKLLTISNKDYLFAIYQLLEKSSIDNNVVELTEEQRLMMELSDKDIENNRIISQTQLNSNDLEWLKGL